VRIDARALSAQSHKVETPTHELERKSLMSNAIVCSERGDALAVSPLSLSLLPREAQSLLVRMFANPTVLEKQERVELVKHLRKCVAGNPKNSDLRVVLGMALCVNLEAHAAMDELSEAVSLAPESFIAHLKAGELWMRLRVMTKAEDHTRQASLLAKNFAQAELARRQAATIRTMRREGIDRGGYRTPWLSMGRFKRLWSRSRRKPEELATVDAG
jgi:cytochrome c-type biogenesis protein CcmH/NrfG